MLHITNGDCAAELIHQAGVAGSVLPWRDVLHEGPVPAGLSLDELRPVRARFFAEAAWDTYETVLDHFARRDATLMTFPEHEEVVLWFEHDLYDQLQLVQLLAFFAQHDLTGVKLSLVCTDEYLGSCTITRLQELFEARHEVSLRERDEGHRAWNAFSSSDPTDVLSLLQEGAPALPFVDGACRRHLQQFPSTTNGLSRSDQQALEAIAGGATSLRDAFVVSQAREERRFLGDATFAWYLEQLSEGNHALVTLAEGDAIRLPRHDTASQRDFWQRRAVLTETGRAVLAGTLDRIAVRGIDRWFGGVHLSGNDIEWRWDPAVQRLAARRDNGV
jgi:hypothetical protein